MHTQCKQRRFILAICTYYLQEVIKLESYCLYSFVLLFTLLHTVFHSAIQMFPTSVRPQHLAGGAALTVKEAMEGSAPVAFVHKACAWLDRSSTVPTNVEGCSFPKKCPQCNPRLATKLCFMYGSPVWLQSLQLQKGRWRSCRRISRKAEKSREPRPGLGPERGRTWPHLRPERQRGKKEGVWQVRISGEMGCKVSKDSERKVRDWNYKCSNKKVKEGNQSLRWAPGGQGGVERNLPSSLTEKIT